MQKLSSGLTVESDKFEKMGLGRIAPFVKLGFEELNGNREEVVDMIQDLAKEVDGEVVKRHDTNLPLGEFELTSDDSPVVEAARLTELMKKFNGLIGHSGGPDGENGFDRLRKVFATVNLLHSTFNDYREYTKPSTGSTHSGHH